MPGFPVVLMLLLIVLSALCGSNKLAAQESDALTQARKLKQNSQTEALTEYLIPAIENGELRGREKIIGLDMLVRAHHSLGNLDQALDHNGRLKLEAEHAGDELYIGRSFLNNGEIVQTQGKHQEAISHFRQALHHYKIADNPKFIANALLELSSSHGHINQNIEALNYALQSLEIGEEIEDLTTIANAYNSIGIQHDNMGNLSEALEAHMKTIELDRQRGDIDELATSYFNVASIYKKMDDYENAKFFTQEALALDLPGNNPDYLGHDYNMLAELDLATGNLKAALQNAKLAEQYFRAIDAEGHLGLVFNNMARVYLLQQDIEQATNFVDQAKAFNQKVGHDKQLAQSLLIKAEILISQNLFSEALAILENNIEVTLERKNFEHIRTLFTLRSQAYERSGQAEKALEAYKDFYRLKDQFEAENHSSIMAQLQNQMDYLQKEHRIELLETQSNIKQLQLEREQLEKKLWIAGLLLIVLLLAVIGYKERTRRKLAAMEKKLLADSVQQKNAMLAEVAHELRSPLTALKLQIESLQYNLEDQPEMAYRRLNNKIDELNTLIEDLYDLARADNGLLKLNFEPVKVKDLLLEITEGYREVVEHKGLKITTSVNITEDEHFTVDGVRLKQVIANLLRNSINYTDAPGTINCSVSRLNDKVQIVLEDSAPGVMPEEIPRLFERMYRADGTKNHDQHGSGLGLSICKSLVEAHNGKINAEVSHLGGLKVSIQLPADLGTDDLKKAA